MVEFAGGRGKAGKPEKPPPLPPCPDWNICHKWPMGHPAEPAAGGPSPWRQRWARRL